MELIKDASGRTIGQKVVRGSQTIVQDASGKTLGRYDENTNQTYDASGKARFKGDQTSALVQEQ